MRIAALACIALLAVSALGSPAKRALLIGIDDYTASTLPAAGAVADRGWPDLRGAANDVRILTDMLVLRYGFARANIVTLTNQQATRAAILRAIEEHLVRPSRQGDIVFYYFAGHGAQVPNPASDEPDRRDESVIPADSRRGAPDIRDKELRPLFNRILERGARLTLLLDHCHSGSGFRGLPNGARPRGIGPAPPIRDGRNYGPRPDERGALILASTQDLDTAWETPGDDGLMHGAFTWAWIGAMRDAISGEAAQETFLRAQARLRVDRADQAPAMLGNARARLEPFLGMQRRRERLVIAVERVNDDEVVLQGGWAHGLTVDTELSPIGDRLARVRVTRLLGLGRSVARTSASNIRAGALLEVVRWAPPPERPLRIFAPGVQLPATEAINEADGIVRVGDAGAADYLLASRFDGTRVEYAWIRPHSRDSDRAASGLPPRTAWTSEPMQLRRDLVTLRRIQAWLSLTSPPDTPSPYRLALRDERTKQLVDEPTVTGGRVYSIVLRTSHSSPDPRIPRYYYVFVVDSHGNSHLVFPHTGSVENRFPIGDPAGEIPLGNPSAFRIVRPFGVDTYFLLSTEEPLPNPAILEWDGVRARRALTATPWSIERLTLESVAPARRRASAAPAAPRRR
jgi:caspase domain-containing protein